MDIRKWQKATKKWQKSDIQSDKKMTDQDKESVGDWEVNQEIFLRLKRTKEIKNDKKVTVKVTEKWPSRKKVTEKLHKVTISFQ